MIESHAVLEVSDGIFDLGVAAMVGLQFQGIPVPVGDEAVIAVGGEEGQRRRTGSSLGVGPSNHWPIGDQTPVLEQKPCCTNGEYGTAPGIGLGQPSWQPPVPKGGVPEMGSCTVRDRRKFGFVTKVM